MNLKPMIRERRMEKHMNQKSFADALSVKQTQLSRYERGASIPSLEILYRMESILNCSLKDLYFEE